MKLFNLFNVFQYTSKANINGLYGSPFNILVTLGTDGTWYGTDGVFGSVTPDRTITLQTFYGLKWKADGTFVMQFGVAGNEQIADVVDIKLYTRYQTAPVIVVWNETNAQYEGIDLTLATDLIAEQTGGVTLVKFDAEIEPTLFISYDYNLETTI